MDQLDFVWDGAQVQRFHTWETIRTDSVGIHSFRATLLLATLRPNASAALLRAMLKHDLAERRTGDMPSPTKRKLGIRDIFQAYEDECFEEAGVVVEALTVDEEWVLKLCDNLDGLFFCANEMALGNRLILEPYCNFHKYTLQHLLEGDSQGYTQAADWAAFQHIRSKAHDNWTHTPTLPGLGFFISRDGARLQPPPGQ